MEKKVSASRIVILWCVLHALIIDASQKVHVPETDCSAEANIIILCMFFIERRSVSSHTHGSKISGSQQYWSLSNNQSRQQQESLDWQNNNHFFVHFLTVVARLQHEASSFNAPIFCSG